MAWMVLNTAMKVSSCKDRDKLRAIMVSNIAIDFVIGLVPFLGDIADTFFRCNTKNAVAFEKMLNDRVRRPRSGGELTRTMGHTMKRMWSKGYHQATRRYIAIATRQYQQILLYQSQPRQSQRHVGAGAEVGSEAEERQGQIWRGAKATLRPCRLDVRDHCCKEVHDEWRSDS